jgi:hypothetical protein
MHENKMKKHQIIAEVVLCILFFCAVVGTQIIIFKIKHNWYGRPIIRFSNGFLSCS